jgi:hypothetical protein
VLLEEMPAATPPLPEPSVRAGVFRIENTSTYLAQTARDRVAGAQAILDQHVATAINGLCGSCERPSPCDTYEDALRTLTGYGGGCPVASREPPNRRARRALTH